MALTGSQGLSFWNYRSGLEGAISPTSTASGLFVTASSTFSGGLRLEGSATTTNRLYVATDLAVGTTTPYAGAELSVAGDLFATRLVIDSRGTRSEERRVGKECRSR